MSEAGRAIIPARYLSALRPAARALGPKADARLAALEAKARTHPALGPALDYRAVDRFLGDWEDDHGRDDYGLTIGQAIGEADHGALSPALGAGRDFDANSRLIARHADHIAPAFRIDYEHRADRCLLRFRPILPVSDRVMRLSCESFALNALKHLVALSGGPLTEVEAHVSTERPAQDSARRRVAGLPINFGTTDLPGVLISVPTDLALRPRQSPAWPPGPGHPGLPLGLASRLFEGPSGVTLIEWVRMMLRGARHRQPRIEDLAALLGVAPATLARRLKREGVSFRDLSVHIRHQRARDLLRGTGLSITQIADLLGYAETSGFTNAFVLAEGRAPSDYRRAIRGC